MEEVGAKLATHQSMKIHNPSGLATIDYRAVKPLQGDLKDLTDKNHDKLLRVLMRRGFTTPLFVWQNGEEYYLLDGHQRQRVMVRNSLNDAGNFNVPFVLIQAKDIVDAKAQLLEITSQYGRMTVEGLDAFSNDIDTDILNDLNFDAVDIDKLLDNQIDGDSEDDVPPPVDDVNPAVSQLGEVYQLGGHRLMCGDSTEETQVATLLNGAVPNLMVTDPPYGVEYDPEWRDGQDLGVGERSKGKVMNDDRVDWSEAYRLFPGDVVYIWHAGVYSPTVGLNLEDCGFNLISQIIWVKQHFALSRGDYHWQHEPCWYAVRQGKTHHWQGSRDLSTTWQIKNNNSFGNSDKEETWGHGTQKPLECMRRPIRNNTSRGDAVYDPFGGSGTTLIAAAELERICYMMELDPKYCDVIRKRYAKQVGAEDWAAATPVIPTSEPVTV